MAQVLDLSRITNITEYPNSFKRQGAFPLERYSIFTSLEGADNTSAKYYAANNPIAYVGQIIVVADGTSVTAYVISSAAGDLTKLAATTESGNLADDINTLKTRIGNAEAKIGDLESVVGDATKGLVYDVDQIEATVAQHAEAIAALASKVSSVKGGDASITIGGTATDPTVSVAISSQDGNTLELKTDGLYVNVPEITVPEYSLGKLETADEGYSATYQLTKDGAAVGDKINIPKDLVVSKGEIVVLAEGEVEDHAAGTYIKLTIADDANDVLYINVTDLLDEMPVEAATDDKAVVVTVDNTTGKYVVSADIKSGAVATGHIADKAVTKGKLSEDVQTSLGKADTAVQSVSIESGSSNGTVKLTVDGTPTEASVAGLGDAAYKAVATSISTSDTGVATASQVASAIASAVEVYRWE